MSTSEPSRRDLLQALGAGLLVAVAAPELAAAQPTDASRRGGTGERGDQRGGERPPARLAARLHIGVDGVAPRRAFSRFA